MSCRASGRPPHRTPHCLRFRGEFEAHLDSDCFTGGCLSRETGSAGWKGQRSSRSPISSTWNWDRTPGNATATCAISNTGWSGCCTEVDARAIRQAFQRRRPQPDHKAEGGAGMNAPLFGRCACQAASTSHNKRKNTTTSRSPRRLRPVLPRRAALFFLCGALLCSILFCVARLFRTDPIVEPLQRGGICGGDVCSLGTEAWP